VKSGILYGLINKVDAYDFNDRAPQFLQENGLKYRHYKGSDSLRELHMPRDLILNEFKGVRTKPLLDNLNSI
jgi:hypothetical protein